MAWGKLTLKCNDCGDTWSPRGAGISGRCNNCGSDNVVLVRNRWPFVVGGLLAAVAVFAATHTREKAAPASPMPPPAGQPVEGYQAPIRTEPLTASAPSVQAQAAQSNTQQDSAAAHDQPGAAQKESGETKGSGAPGERSPGTGCAAAASRAAQKICASPALTQADEELSALYSFTLQASSDKQSVAKEQREWQQKVRDACADEDCMLAAYRERSQQLASQALNAAQ